MAAFRQAARGLGTMDREELLKEASIRLGFERMGSKVHITLTNHLRAALRRGVIDNEGHRVRAGRATMDEYDRDDLVDTIKSVTSKGCVYEREELVHMVAAHLGFTRVTAQMHEPVKSAVNAAIRREVLERDGVERVRRV
jgi:hypothetical protein